MQVTGQGDVQVPNLVHGSEFSWTEISSCISIYYSLSTRIKDICTQQNPIRLITCLID